MLVRTSATKEPHRSTLQKGAASTRPSERAAKRERRSGSSSSPSIARTIEAGKMPGATHSQCGSSLSMAW
eukprot:scaffold93456_cov18-Phaeocystis_antarctica.AAC.1